MAGAYPDLLSHRMLVDVDGAVAHTISGGVRTELMPSELAILNSEGTDVLGPTTDVEQYLMAFPDLRDISGLYLGFVQADPADWIDVTVEGSSDTYTGLDGTWSTVYDTNRVSDGSSVGWWGHTAPGDYRRYIRAISPVTGLRALRVVVTPQTPGTTAWSLQAMHVYGAISAGQNPHRLEIGDPVLDQRVAPGHFDWGNVPLGSSADKTFRVRNLSPYKRAEGVVVSVEALTDADPSAAAQHLLSYGGSAYAATVTIPAIAPGARSGLVTLRRITPSTAATGPWALRVRGLPTSWTDVA